MQILLDLHGAPTWRRVAGASCLLLLAACSGTRDPGKAGFLDGLRNQATGVYTEDLNKKKAEVAGVAAANELLEEDIGALEERERQTARRLEAARAQSNDLRRRVTELKQKYELEQEKYNEELRVVRQIELDLNAQDRRLTELPVDASVDRKSQEVDASLNRLRELSQLVSTLP